MARHRGQPPGRLFKGNRSTLLSGCGSCCKMGLAFSITLSSEELLLQQHLPPTPPALVPAFCLSRGALRGPCSCLWPPFLHFFTHCFPPLVPGLSLNCQFYITCDFRVTTPNGFYSLPTWWLSLFLSSLNPTLSVLCPGASFTVWLLSLSPCSASAPMSSCSSAAGSLLDPLVSGCLIPHPQGKPIGHGGRGCKARRTGFQPSGLGADLPVLWHCVGLCCWPCVLR